MAKLLSGTRIYGNTSVDTFITVGSNVSISGANNSTSNLTGALVISTGGLGVVGSVYTGNHVITGTGNGITFVDGTTQTTSPAATASYANSAFSSSNGTNLTQNTSITAAFLQANSAFTAANTADSKAVTAGSYANSAFSSSNGTNLTQNTSITAAFLQANSAFSSSNGTNLTQNTSITAAFLKANTPPAIANSAALYANGAFVQANAAYTRANSSGLVLLSTVTAAASATVDVETTFDSTYNTYLLIVDSVILSNTTSNLLARVKVSGSYANDASYQYHITTSSSASTSYSADADQSGSSIVVAGSETTQTSFRNMNFSMYIRHPSEGATTRPVMDWTGTFRVTNTTLVKIVGSAGYSVLGSWTGVRFLPEGGTITSGTFRLYGIINS